MPARGPPAGGPGSSRAAEGALRDAAAALGCRAAGPRPGPAGGGEQGSAAGARQRRRASRAAGERPPRAPVLVLPPRGRALPAAPSAAAGCRRSGPAERPPPGRLPSAIILCSRRGGGGDGAGLGSIFEAGAPPAGGARPGPRVPPPAGRPGPRRAPFPSLPPAPVRWAPSSSYRLRAAPSLLSFAPGISPQFYSLPHVTHRVKLHLRRVTHTHTGAPSPATGRQRPTEERQPGSKRRARRGPHGNRRALTETAERAASGGNGRARRRPPRKEPSGRGNERSAPEGWRKEPSGRGKARTALPPEAARGAGGGAGAGTSGRSRKRPNRPEPRGSRGRAVACPQSAPGASGRRIRRALVGRRPAGPRVPGFPPR